MNITLPSGRPYRPLRFQYTITKRICQRFYAGFYKSYNFGENRGRTYDVFISGFAIYTATKRSAELAGVGDETGSIEKGKCADMIVVSGNPLEDLRVLRKPDTVIARGEIYKNPKVKRNKKVDYELDKFL